MVEQQQQPHQRPSTSQTALKPPLKVTNRAPPPNSTPNALGIVRGGPASRGASIAGGRKGAMRGGSSLAPKNVFASREPVKKRATFIENASDASRDGKHFSNMRLRRKAQLAGREVADAAPDIDALGGLFDPSKPATFQSLKPAIIRKPAGSTTMDNDNLSGSPPSPHEGSLPIEVSTKSPVSVSRPQWNPSDPLNAICYYWHTRGTCIKGYNCNYFHSDSMNYPVAPEPKGQVLKQQPCKYWTSGYCRKTVGECGYLHENSQDPLQPKSDLLEPRKQIEPPAPPRKPPTILRDGKTAVPTGPRKTVSFAVDEPIPFTDEPGSLLVPPSRPSAMEPPSQNKTKKNTPVCHYWTREDCRYGDACWYRHSDATENQIETGLVTQSLNKSTTHITSSIFAAQQPTDTCSTTWENSRIYLTDHTFCLMSLRVIFKLKARVPATFRNRRLLSLIFKLKQTSTLCHQSKTDKKTPLRNRNVQR